MEGRKKKPGDDRMICMHTSAPGIWISYLSLCHISWDLLTPAYPFQECTHAPLGTPIRGSHVSQRM